MAALLASLVIFWFFLGPNLASGDCLPSYTAIGGGCFLAIKDANVDFLSARELCQNFNGDLAIVDDCALLGELSAYLSSADVGIGNIWIGATDLASEGTWRWIDGREVPSRAPFWGRQNAPDHNAEPSGGVDQNCAAMSVGAGYYFQDLDCSLSAGYAPLCQILAGLNETCPSPYVSVGGSCLEFLPTLDVSWDDARVVCQINGGDLAIIDDCHLMAAVINYATENALVPANGFWIGGSDAVTEGAWTWLDGSSMAMGVPFWGRTGTGPLEPDDAPPGEGCLKLGYDRLYYNDDVCTDEMNALCQSDVV